VSAAPNPDGQPVRRKAGARSRSATAAEQQQAARFARIRRDHAAEIAEDYCELIARLIAEVGEARIVDIARHLGVSHVTVTKTVARLQRDGLVHSQPYRAIFLTDAGAAMAREAAARHELVARFLRCLGVNQDDAETDAEGLEHHLSPATIDAIRQFIATRS
jgi:DtxR family manganese transport transcriptional regulator